MGLSERKFKQKINADPRNLTWADNAAKFGQAYLAKHGWTPNTGLGVAGDGRTTHITVAQKLNMLGIGANRPDGPDAIAWKQAKEFEGLLERLNTAGSGEATPIEVEEKVEETATEGGDEKEDKARRKEKRREEKRKAKAAKAAAQDEDESAPSTPTPAEEPTPVAAPAPRRLAHRARFLAAKRMAGTSSTALSEILGIASTPASTSGPSTPATPATPAPTLTAIPVLDDSNQITTSTQSVADYFKSKMRERAQAAITSTPVVTFEEPEVDVAPRTGLGARRSDPEEEETRPTGLGFSSGSGLGFAPATGLGFTRATEPQSSPAESESGSHTPSSTLSESADPKTDKKRKRKEVPAAEPGTEAVQDNEATETEAQRKAAKRARKEAKRAAREASGDQPLKKKKRKDKVGEAL